MNYKMLRIIKLKIYKVFARLVFSIFNVRLNIKSYYNVKILFNNDTTYNCYLTGKYGDIIANEVKKLSAKDLFIDVGANQGLFSILASKNGARVISFEPNFKIYTLLISNLVINNCKKVNTLNLAIYNKFSQMSLQSFEGQSGKSYLINDNNESHNTLTVNSEFLSVFRKIDCDKCMIKVDVEGAEYIVLSEFKKIIKTDLRINTIIVEINYEHLKRFSSSPQKIYNLMEELNFTPSIKSKNPHYDEIFYRNSSL